MHLAALAGVRSSLLDPLAYEEVNIRARSIFWKWLANTRSKLCLCSSSSVYGNNKKQPFSESDSVDTPISPMRPPRRPQSSWRTFTAIFMAFPPLVCAISRSMDLGDGRIWPCSCLRWNHQRKTNQCFQPWENEPQFHLCG